MLLLARLATGASSYLELIHCTLGDRWRLVAKACLLVILLGNLAGCVNVLTDVLSFSAGGIIPPGADNITTWHTVVLMLITALTLAARR
jgi:hypothetical protein